MFLCPLNISDMKYLCFRCARESLRKTRIQNLTNSSISKSRFISLEKRCDWSQLFIDYHVVYLFSSRPCVNASSWLCLTGKSSREINVPSFTSRCGIWRVIKLLTQGPSDQGRCHWNDLFESDPDVLSWRGTWRWSCHVFLFLSSLSIPSMISDKTWGIFLSFSNRHARWNQGCVWLYVRNQTIVSSVACLLIVLVLTVKVWVYCTIGCVFCSWCCGGSGGFPPSFRAVLHQPVR